MAKIKLSGYGELIEISNKTAENIRRDLLNERIPKNQLIEVSKEIVCEKGAIKAVFLDEERKDNKEFFQKFDEYKNEWIKRVNLTPFVKALRTRSYFKLWFKTLKEREPNEDELSKSVELSEKWFEENRLRNYPDPRIFSELVGEISEEKTNVYGTFIHTKPLVRKGIINIIGNVIQRDIQISKEYSLSNQATKGDEINVASIPF